MKKRVWGKNWFVIFGVFVGVLFIGGLALWYTTQVDNISARTFKTLRVGMSSDDLERIFGCSPKNLPVSDTPVVKEDEIIDDNAVGDVQDTWVHWIGREKVIAVRFDNKGQAVHYVLWGDDPDPRHVLPPLSLFEKIRCWLTGQPEPQATMPPGIDPPSPSHSAFKPFIFTREQLVAILAAARQLPDNHVCRHRAQSPHLTPNGSQGLGLGVQVSTAKRRSFIGCPQSTVPPATDLAHGHGNLYTISIGISKRPLAVLFRGDACGRQLL